MSHAIDMPVDAMLSDEETLKESKLTRAKSPKRSDDASPLDEKTSGDDERVVEQSSTEENGEEVAMTTTSEGAMQWVTLNDGSDKVSSAGQPKRSVLKTKEGEESRDAAKVVTDGEKRGGKTIAFGAVVQVKHFKRSEEEQQLIKGVQKKNKDERESSSDSEGDVSVGDDGRADDNDESSCFDTELAADNDGGADAEEEHRPHAQTEEGEPHVHLVLLSRRDPLNWKKFKGLVHFARSPPPDHPLFEAPNLTQVQSMWLYMRQRIEDNWLKQRPMSDLDDADKERLFGAYDRQVARQRRKHNHVFGTEQQQVPPPEKTLKQARDGRTVRWVGPGGYNAKGEPRLAYVERNPPKGQTHAFEYDQNGFRIVYEGPPDPLVKAKRIIFDDESWNKWWAVQKKIEEQQEYQRLYGAVEKAAAVVEPTSRQTYEMFNFDEEWTRDNVRSVRGAKSQQTAKPISMEHLFGLDDFADISLDATKRTSHGRHTGSERQRQSFNNRPPVGNTNRSFRKFDSGFDDTSTFKQREQRDFKPSRQWASSRSRTMCAPLTQYFAFLVDKVFCASHNEVEEYMHQEKVRRQAQPLARAQFQRTDYTRTKAPPRSDSVQFDSRYVQSGVQQFSVGNASLTQHFAQPFNPSFTDALQDAISSDVEAYMRQQSHYEYVPQYNYPAYYPPASYGAYYFPY